jgi:hypothetical protein
VTLYIGSKPRLIGRFKRDNVLTDPDTVTLKIKAPSGAETTYAYPADVAKQATGVYYYDLPITESGIWYWRWIGTGAVADANEGEFPVEESSFQNP